jgi:hypothetical protein
MVGIKRPFFSTSANFRLRRPDIQTASSNRRMGIEEQGVGNVCKHKPLLSNRLQSFERRFLIKYYKGTVILNISQKKFKKIGEFQIFYLIFIIFGFTLSGWYFERCERLGYFG